MAYNVTGGLGNDTLEQTSDSGPGTIVGLAGNDCILTGTGLVTVDGGSGDDTVILQAGNTGTVQGGIQNDSIGFAANVGSMFIFGSDGADTIATGASTNPQTILGGNDSNDGPDLLLSGTGSDIVFGNGGNDTIASQSGNDTVIGGAGNDTIFEFIVGSGNDLVFGNEGNDTIFVPDGSDTVFAGTGNDFVATAGPGAPTFFLNEGNDTFDGASAGAGVTVVGGNDSADGADSLVGSAAGDILFGNGGADTIVGSGGPDTVIGGFSGDRILTGFGADFIFGNEGDDSIHTGFRGTETVFAGQGADTVFSGVDNDTLLGNEGNDMITGNGGLDTISGGDGADWFVYLAGFDDGDNVAAGGSTELIIDLNWAQDRFLVFAPVAFANATSPGAAASLAQAATNAIASVWAANGSPTANVAAQFDFGGRTYVAINQGGAFNVFNEASDLLIDITGAVSAIAVANFTT